MLQGDVSRPQSPGAALHCRLARPGVWRGALMLRCAALQGAVHDTRGGGGLAHSPPRAHLPGQGRGHADVRPPARLPGQVQGALGPSFVCVLQVGSSSSASGSAPARARCLPCGRPRRQPVCTGRQALLPWRRGSALTSRASPGRAAATRAMADAPAVMSMLSQATPRARDPRPLQAARC